MAKKGIETRNGIPVRCEYCKHNDGENKQFGYMWHCSHLSFCTISMGYCIAKKERKGDFELDKDKYDQWISTRKNDIRQS